MNAASNTNPSQANAAETANAQSQPQFVPQQFQQVPLTNAQYQPQFYGQHQYQNQQQQPIIIYQTADASPFIPYSETGKEIKKNFGLCAGLSFVVSMLFTPLLVGCALLLVRSLSKRAGAIFGAGLAALLQGIGIIVAAQYFRNTDYTDCRHVSSTSSSSTVVICDNRGAAAFDRSNTIVTVLGALLIVIAVPMIAAGIISLRKALRTAKSQQQQQQQTSTTESHQ